MLNIMLVDDDYPVLEFLQRAVPWETLGMNVQGIYESGIKAFEAARVSPPDILITDIGMPHMNGLELIEKMKGLQPQIMVAILSCHNEFAFAQQALKLQVKDYILKETIEIEDMVNMLEKLAVQVRAAQLESQKDERLLQMTKENATVSMDKFLNSLLEQTLLFPERLAEMAEDYGITFASHAYVPVVCLIDRYEQVQKRFVSGDNLMFAIVNVVEEWTRGSEKVILFRLSRRRLLLLFPYPRTSPSYFGIHKMESTLQDIQRSLSQYLKVSVTFLSGQKGEDILSLRASIRELLQGSVDYRFYAKGSVIEPLQPLEFSNQDLFMHYSSALEQFKQITLDQASERVGEVTSYWGAHITQEQYRPSIVKEWFLKIMLDLQFKIKKLQNFQSSTELEVLHQSILETETIEQLLEEVAAHLQLLFPAVEHINKQPLRKEIADAQLYVTRAISRKVTQEEVADYLHLNPSYFSRLFKKETGENFVEFTTRTKMEKAKELIDQTDCTVEALAQMLGYDNKSYFLKCFKNYTGLTPREYAGKIQKAGSENNSNP